MTSTDSIRWVGSDQIIPFKWSPCHMPPLIIFRGDSCSVMLDDVRPISFRVLVWALNPTVFLKVTYWTSFPDRRTHPLDGQRLHPTSGPPYGERHPSGVRLRTVHARAVGLPGPLLADWRRSPERKGQKINSLQLRQNERDGDSSTASCLLNRLFKRRSN